MLERVVRFGTAAVRARDRVLHPLRRRAAHKRISQYRGTSIIVLCHGNVCRSPFAEAVLRASLPGTMEVRSAGFVGSGRCAPPDAVSAARRFGFDLATHYSRLVTPGLVRASGLLVVMDVIQRRELIQRLGARPEQVVVLGDLDPLPIETREISDPMQKSREDFIDCYDRIDRCARDLGRTLYRAARSRTPMYGEPPLPEVRRLTA